jgi:hypothetical protein
LAAVRKALSRARREVARIDAWGPLPQTGRVRVIAERARKRVADLEATIAALEPLKALRPGPRVKS